MSNFIPVGSVGIVRVFRSIRIAAIMPAIQAVLPPFIAAAALRFSLIITLEPLDEPSSRVYAD